MLYLLVGLGLVISYFAYRFLESKEHSFINDFLNPYGPLVDAVNLDLFSVGGRDRLRWGTKLYLFKKGMVIGESQGGADNVQISLKDIKELTAKGKELIFYHKIDGANLPVKFQLSGNQLQKKLAGLENKIS